LHITKHNDKNNATFDCFSMLCLSLLFWSILASREAKDFWFDCRSFATLPTSRRAYKNKNSWIWVKKNNFWNIIYLCDIFIHVIHVIFLCHSVRFHFVQFPHFQVDFTHLFLLGLFSSIQLFFIVINRALPSFNICCKRKNLNYFQKHATNKKSNAYSEYREIVRIPIDWKSCSFGFQILTFSLHVLVGSYKGWIGWRNKRVKH